MTDSCSAFVAFEAKNRVLKGKKKEARGKRGAADFCFAVVAFAMKGKYRSKEVFFLLPSSLFPVERIYYA